MRIASGQQCIGACCLVIAVALFSTIEIAGKIIGNRVAPVTLTAIRFSVTGTVLLSVASLRCKKNFSGLTWKDVAGFFLNGFIGITLAISLFHLAVVQFEKAASAAVVFSVNPVFVVIAARFINREEWTMEKWTAVLLGTAGVACFAWESGTWAADSVTGLVTMLVAAALFGLSICFAKQLMCRHGAMVTMGFSALFGSVLLLPFAVFDAIRNASEISRYWIPVIYIAFAGTAIPYFLYYTGIMKTSVQKGSMAFFLKPVLASVLAGLILGETINRFMIAGTLCILWGLFLAVIVGQADSKVARTELVEID